MKLGTTPTIKLIRFSSSGIVVNWLNISSIEFEFCWTHTQQLHLQATEVHGTTTCGRQPWSCWQSTGSCAHSNCSLWKQKISWHVVGWLTNHIKLIPWNYQIYLELSLFSSTFPTTVFQGLGCLRLLTVDWIWILFHKRWPGCTSMPTRSSQTLKHYAPSWNQPCSHQSCLWHKLHSLQVVEVVTSNSPSSWDWWKCTPSWQWRMLPSFSLPAAIQHDEAESWGAHPLQDSG